MNKTIPLSCVALGVLIASTLITPAFSQQHKPEHTPLHKASTPSQMMHMSMSKMGKNMATMKMTGEVDRDFAMMMAEHHLGAIQMAEIEVKHGKSPALRAMAKKMIETQKKERADLLKHAKMRH